MTLWPSPSMPNSPTETQAAPKRLLSVALPAAVISLLPAGILGPRHTLREIELAQLAETPLKGADAPDLVLSPLLTPEFDALDLAHVLTQAGFAGTYLALVRALPSPDLVRREVGALAPGLRFDVIVLDQPAALRAV